MFMYYRNLLRSDGLFLFERKVEKIDQTTILANGFKELSEPTFISPDGKYTSNRGEANTISTFRILKRKIRIKGQTSSLGKDHGILQLTQLEISFSGTSIYE
jgi:hypothetical protein